MAPCTGARPTRQREVRGQLGAQVPGVVLCAVDEARLAAPQERQSHHVHPRRVDDAAIVAQPALAIEDGDVEPRVIRPEAGGPDDRPDLSPAQIEARAQ
jgi:hypothetical protein